MAERYADLAFAVAAEIGDPAADAIIRHQASLFRSGLGDFERVLADEDAAIAIYRETGDLGRLRDCLGVAGVAAHQGGHTDRAARYFADLLATRRRDEPFLQEIWAHTWLGAAALRAGEVDSALEHLMRAHARREGPGHEAFQIVIDAQLALAHHLAGAAAESERAAARARGAIAATRARPVMHGVLDGYSALAELALRTGDEPALARACRDLGAFTRVFPVGEPARRRFEGELAALRGRPDAARAAFSRAVSAAQRLGMRHERALARERLDGRRAEVVA
jgi:tetratricopeptide (TPR) repeat protein